MFKKYLKLLILIVISLLIGHQIVTHYPKAIQNEKTKIVILWSGLGEYAWASRLQNACNRLGWKCTILCDEQKFSSYEKYVLDAPIPIETLRNTIETIRPNFVISLKNKRVICKKFINYLCTTGIQGHLIDSKFSPNSDLLDFDGILYATPHIQQLKNFFEMNHKPFHSLLWYPSQCATNYVAVEPKRIFFCGFQWDKKRDGLEYRKCFALLDQEGILDIYGPKEKWDCALSSVRGMTFDSDQFSEAMRKSGIVLALHSDHHFSSNSPSSRVMEAAAAGCVIICDQLPCIAEIFQDSILYVDNTHSGEKLFEQINKHYQWILSHPIEAEQMAKKAHAIFQKDHTLEHQLQRLLDFHNQQIIANKVKI